jgi:hypothetical protein
VSNHASFGGFLPFSYASDALSVERLKLFICSAEEEEGGGSWRFYPRSCVAEGIQRHHRRAEWISNKPGVRVFQDHSA